MGRTLIKNATIVLGGHLCNGSLFIDGDTISEILRNPSDSDSGVNDVSFSECIRRADSVVDADGALLFPGIIDDHVHFRQPGLTHKGTIESESRAAVAGGVTSYFDMPNCIPQTTTLQTLRDKCSMASESSLANYSFYLGATRQNLPEIEQASPKDVCGVKMFMGSSTGGMLVDDDEHVFQVFKCSPVPVAVHCEDTGIINRNMEAYTARCGGEPPVVFHPLIRSAEACYASSSRAISLAVKAGAHLHLLHVSTARELSLLQYKPLSEKTVTAEACPGYLCFCDEDYQRLGPRIKVNPAIKSKGDREALRQALASGVIDVIGTDHAPHLLSEKQGGCKSAASGMPVLPYSLPVMLRLADEGIITIQDIARLMCHNPALIFKVEKRGFIKTGYKADLTLVRKCGNTASDYAVPNKCAWTPFNGHAFGWKVVSTWVNGNLVYDRGEFFSNHKGEQITFNR